MSPDALNTTFAALADPTRRAILARLTEGEASVMELAEPFEMSLPAISKHLKVLERAGLIVRGREAQWRPSRLEAGPLMDAAEWLEQYRRFWEQSFDRLEEYLNELKLKEKKMNERTNVATNSSERELVITRVFDAPRELVFKAWTEPEHMMHWFGPQGFTMTLCRMELRAGSPYRFEMRSPAGTEHRLQGVLREIVEPERLVMTSAWVDAEGKPGQETVLALSFADHGGKTMLTLRQTGFESITARDAHQGGWSSALECLEEYLANAQSN